jgi:hypothetical protein
MTQQPPSPGAGESSPIDEPARRTAASYATYEEAENAVDYLADQQFPVERVAIVGHDVKLVEQVVGRMSYGRAALHGACGGAVTGVLIGWIFGLLSWIESLLSSLALALYGLIFGAIVGALISLVTYALQGGRRDFAAVQHMVPSRYEVLVDTEVADEAARLLQQRQGTREDVTGSAS